jgi:hypothetical protein
MTILEVPILILLLALILVLYAATGLFLNLLSKENPAIFKEVATKENLHGSSLGATKFGLLYIITLEYDAWNLSKKGRWAGRALLILNLLYLLSILLLIGSLLHPILKPD